MIDKPGWKRLSSTVLFESTWLQLRRDEAIRPDGSLGECDHVVVPAAVTVLAVGEDRRLAVTRQWIYVHDGRQWRLPAGRIDAVDPDPESAARRELAEETGINAERLVPLGAINCGDSFSNHQDHAFLATGLSPGPTPTRCCTWSAPAPCRTPAAPSRCSARTPAACSAPRKTADPGWVSRFPRIEETANSLPVNISRLDTLD